MRRHLPLVVLVAAQLFVAAAAMAFHRWTRPQLLAGYAELGVSLGVGARLALSSWLLPAAATAGVACAVLAAVHRGQRARRLRLLGLGLTVSGLLFVTAALLAVAPLFG